MVFTCRKIGEYPQSIERGPFLYLTHSNRVHRGLDVVHAVADGECLRLKADRPAIRSGSARRVYVHIDGLRRGLVVEIKQLQDAHRMRSG